MNKPILTQRNKNNKELVENAEWEKAKQECNLSVAWYLQGSNRIIVYQKEGWADLLNFTE